MAENSPLPKGNSTAALKASLPSVSIPMPRRTADYATILGLVFAVSLIFIAIYMGESDASFFNIPSVAIVILGTIAVTAISYTGEEIRQAGSIITQSLMRRIYEPQKVANMLLDLAVVSKKKGILALSAYEDEIARDNFLHRSLQMAIDGQKPADIDFILSQEIAARIERHKRSASITKRASETAPAMGLIGTLVGLVQMLANLESPETIGPAMAVALLTTFYGAILGTVVMAPLAGKLDKNSQDETLIKNMIRLTAIAVARQDNPRKLEMELNSALPPQHKIKYFD